MYTFLFCLIFAITHSLLGYDFSSAVKKIDTNTASVSLTFALKPTEYLYKENLTITVNNPHIKLSQAEPSSPAVKFFDEASKKEKEGYTGTVTFRLTAQKNNGDDIPQGLIHAHFNLNTTAHTQEKIIQIEFTKIKHPEVAPKAPVTPVAPVHSTKPTVAPAGPACEPLQPSLLGSFIKRTLNWVHVTATKAKKYITDLFTSTGSRTIRFGASLLLGILLSLTPCIYPMIPITVGILQASGTGSAFSNFILAFCYTLGISTTFAILGFLAAVGSCVFGELQGSPFIVIPLALLLLYFAFSMFDWITLYIPKFLQPKTGKVKGGSPLAAYTFGALSGTIASPCLSPGLILILNYVTQSGAQHFTGYLEGFLLLFLFGIGSSLPLLIIGTFSSSLHMLPKAGMWMVEIKKLVGLMLIAMAFYQLSHLERLLPWYLFVWVIVLTLFALGIYYFASIAGTDRTGMKRYKNFMGVFLIVAACLMMIQGQKALYDHLYPSKAPSAWLHNYNEATMRGVQENKLLFIDIGASYCAACKSFDTSIFATDTIVKALSDFIQVKVESDIDVDQYEKIKAHYGTYIEGFPTYLVVDPSTDKVLKKWSIDIDQLSLEGLSSELAQLRSAQKE